MPRKTRVSKYDIPIKLFVQVDDDGELLKLVSAGLHYPYDVRKQLPQLLREVADDLEAMTDGDRA